MAKRQVYKYYDVKGDELTRKKQLSPKGGPGVFMAEHKDRKTCGKTGYTEFNKKE